MVVPNIEISWREKLPLYLTIVLAIFFTLFLAIPLIALIWRSITLESHLTTADLSITAAVWLSLSTTAITILLIIIFGTPLAYILARYDFPFKSFITLLVDIPIVMPPVVAGLALLSAFGRRGLVGMWLAELDISITFTTTAVVLAQLFVASPFYIRAAQSRFATLPREYEEAAAVDGATPWQIFGYIIFPQSGRALLAGLILSWARALGEFGATILFAGNLQGRTQTMPLLVYGALERDLGATFNTALILLGLAVTAFALTRWLAGLDQVEISS